MKRNLCHTCPLFLHCIAVCPENAARLRGGNTQTQGRVEVCILETWQTVCSTRWDNTDASVACRQLGFSGFSKAMDA